MKTIAVFDEKNYNINANRLIREAVRAIIIKNGKIALVKSMKENYYKFPGGGIDDNESHIDTLIRETREEVGLIVIPNSIKECGYILEKRKSLHNDDIFEQTSYYYFVEVEDVIIDQRLSENEKRLQFVLEWVDINKAYNTDIVLGEKYVSKFLLREACVLKLLIDNGYSI